MKPRKLKTHCKHGHEYTPENTRLKRQRGRKPSRECITCQRAHVRQQNAQFTGMNRVQQWEKDRAAVDAMWRRLESNPATTYAQLMLEAKAEFDEWDLRRTEKGRAKLKTHCRREAA